MRQGIAVSFNSMRKKGYSNIYKTIDSYQCLREGEKTTQVIVEILDTCETSSGDARYWVRVPKAETRQRICDGFGNSIERAIENAHLRKVS